MWNEKDIWRNSHLSSALLHCNCLILLFCTFVNFFLQPSILEFPLPKRPWFQEDIHSLCKSPSHFSGHTSMFPTEFLCFLHRSEVWCSPIFLGFQQQEYMQQKGQIANLTAVLLENWRQKYCYKVFLYFSVNEAKPVFESRSLGVGTEVHRICDFVKWLGDIYFATTEKKLGGWCRTGWTVVTKCLAVFNCKHSDSQ